MAAGCHLATESETGSGIQRFGDGLDELFHCREVLCFAIPQVFYVNTREGVWVLLGTKTLVVW